MVEPYPIVWDFWNLFNFAWPLSGEKQWQNQRQCPYDLTTGYEEEEEDVEEDEEEEEEEEGKQK